MSESLDKPPHETQKCTYILLDHVLCNDFDVFGWVIPRVLLSTQGEKEVKSISVSINNGVLRAELKGVSILSLPSSAYCHVWIQRHPPHRRLVDPPMVQRAIRRPLDTQELTDAVMLVEFC